MWLFFAFGGLCRLRKHGSNCPRLAGELKYFCDSSVIYKLAGHRGCHTAALVMRLLVENYLAAESSLGSAGLDELRWPNPVRPGDTLRVRATVVESRRSLSKPDRGIVKTVVEAASTGGATVMRAIAVNFMLVRPDPGA